MKTIKIDEKQYAIALSMIKGIGVKTARTLLAHFGNVNDIFAASLSDLKGIRNIGEVYANKVFKNRSEALKQAELELEFVEKHDIDVIPFYEETFPNRLNQCPDAPIVLYVKGSCRLNQDYNVSIIGTRKCSSSAIKHCKNLVEDLSEYNPAIISGLAYGIDIVAHRESLKKQIPTFAVLAHGLDRIYPSAHRKEATQIIENGALITEFPSGTNPDRENFPKRNRIVAGMSDAIVVVESGLKGGSLITAYLGNDYNKDVFAFPGRLETPANSGCNFLIKTDRARLIESADDLAYFMNWNKVQHRQEVPIPDLSSLDEPSKSIYSIIKEHGGILIDDLALKCRVSVPGLLPKLLTLEFSGLIRSKPGKYYEIT